MMQTPLDNKLLTTPGNNLNIINTNKNPLSLIESTHKMQRRSNQEPLYDITQNWNESGGKSSIQLLMNQQQTTQSDEPDGKENQEYEEGNKEELIKLNLDLNTIKKMSLRSYANESIQKSNATNNHDSSCTPYSVMMFQDRFNQSIQSTQQSNHVYDEANLSSQPSFNYSNSCSQLLNLFKQYLSQLSQEQNVYLSDHFYDQIKYNENNKLLSIVDARCDDRQFVFVIQTLEIMVKAMGESIKIKGLNLNGNVQLTDQSIRTCIKLIKKIPCIKVLSIERWKVSHQGIQLLFNELPYTKIVELNISGISLNYVCIDTLCQVLEHNKPDLRVLHVRNTKLQDSSALRLLEQIIARKAKVKYLGMSINSLLGFQFQNGLLKMLRDSVRTNSRHHIKLLDLKHCNINRQNLLVIQKLIAYNNGVLSENEDVNRLLYSHRTNKSGKSMRSGRNDSHSNSRSIHKGRNSCDPCNISSPQLAILNQRSQSIMDSRNNLEKLSLGNHLVNTELIKSHIFNNSRDQLPATSAYKDQESIHEFIIQQDLSQNNFKTNESLQKEKLAKLNESLGLQVKYSKSCSRQNKSKSLTDISGTNKNQGIIPIIQNLTKLEMIEQIQKSKGVNAGENGKHKPFRVTSASNQSLKSQENKDFSSAGQIKDAYGSQEIFLMDQTFQKQPIQNHYQSLQHDSNVPFSLNASLEIPQQIIYYQPANKIRKLKKAKSRDQTTSVSQKRTPRQARKGSYTSAKMLDRKINISVQCLDQIDKSNMYNTRPKSLSGHQGYTFSKSTRTFLINDQPILDKSDKSDRHSRSSLGIRSNNQSRPQIETSQDPINLIIGGPQTQIEQLAPKFSQLLNQKMQPHRKSTKFIQKRDSMFSIQLPPRQDKRKQPVQKPIQQQRGFHIQQIDMQNNFLRQSSHDRKRASFQQQFVPSPSQTLPNQIHANMLPKGLNRSIRTSIQTTQPNSNLPSQRFIQMNGPINNQEHMLHHQHINSLLIRDLNFDQNPTPITKVQQVINQQIPDGYIEAQKSLTDLKEPQFCPRHDPTNALQHLNVQINNEETKSCSSKSISPLNAHTTSQRSLEQTGLQSDLQNFGNLKNMIKDEITRLESLYKNIDMMMQMNQSQSELKIEHLKVPKENNFQFIQKRGSIRADAYDELQDQYQHLYRSRAQPITQSNSIIGLTHLNTDKSSLTLLGPTGRSHNLSSSTSGVILERPRDSHKMSQQHIKSYKQI